MIRNERPPHLETVRHQSTSVTLVTREFEADVHVETKDQVADGVVALTLRQVDKHPLPRWAPGAHVDLIIDGVPMRQYSLCGEPRDHHRWRLGILRDQDGAGGLATFTTDCRSEKSSGSVVLATTSNWSSRLAISSSQAGSASLRSFR